LLLVGLPSITGKRGGAPGLTLSRAVFGTHGNAGPTLVSWLTLVGWETITCTTAAYALVDLLGRAGPRSGDTRTVITLLVAGAVAASVGLFGHATIMRVQRWLTWIFGTLTLVVIGFLIDEVRWHQVIHQHPGSAGALIGAAGSVLPLTVVVTMGARLAIPLTAWAATIGMDMIRRREFDQEALLDRRPGGRYWYTGGIRWVALLPWLLGIAVGLLFTTASNGDHVWFSGPWAGTWLGGNGLGWLVSGLVSAGLYALLGLRSAAGHPPAGAGATGGPMLSTAGGPATVPLGGPAGGPVRPAGTDR
jgi:purine-cytosine permease-like protein